MDTPTNSMNSASDAAMQDGNQPVTQPAAAPTTPATPNPNIGTPSGAPATLQTSQQPVHPSNSPDADTKAGSSIPAALVNNPAVPTQKMAAQADANKNSDSPVHRMLYNATTEMTGGPRYASKVSDGMLVSDGKMLSTDGKAIPEGTTIPAGQLVHTQLRPSMAALGMSLALQLLSGGLAGLKATGPNRMGEAAQAGMQVGQQQRAAVTAANQKQDENAVAAQNRKLALTKANMQNYQTAILVGKQSQEIADKLGDSTEFFTSGIQDGTIPLGDGMSHSEAIETDTMANIKNGKSNITKDFMLPYGPAIPVMENGVQKTVNGAPAWSHMYMTIHGAVDGKMPLTPELQKAFVDHGLMKNIPPAGIDAKNWPMSDIARKLSDIQSIDTGERLLQDHKNDATEVLGHPGHGGPDGNGVEDLDDLAGKIKSDPQMRKAVQVFAAAQAGSKTDSKTGSKTGNIEDIIDAMRSRDLNAASIIMQHLGLNQNDLNDMRNKRLESETESKSAGTAKGKATAPTKLTDSSARSVLSTNNIDATEPITVDAQGVAHQGTVDLTTDEHRAYNFVHSGMAIKVANTQADQTVKEPFALRKMQQAEALKTGTAADAGQLMANGDLTLTELRSRGSTPKFITDATLAANAYAKTHGLTYNAQKADEDFKTAGSQTNLSFFGSANSLVNKGGTLDQLADNYSKLGNTQFPAFNKVDDYRAYQAGDPALAGFMQTAIGVADDYAKVMGGGGAGSDTSRLQVLQSFSNAHNPAQMGAALQAARDAVKSQVTSRIGRNPMMAKMYGGGGLPTATTTAATTAQKFSIGAWQKANPDKDVEAAKAAAQKKGYTVVQ